MTREIVPYYPEIDMLQIIEDLEDVRKQLGITKTAIIEKIGVPQSTYFKWLNNTWGEKMHPMTVEWLETILSELRLEARSPEDKFLDLLEQNFDHYNTGDSLCKTINLVTLKKELEIEDEDEIIETVHQLVEEGKVKLLMIPWMQTLGVDDIRFEFVIGTGSRFGFTEIPVIHDCNLLTGKIVPTRLYREEPLSARERNPNEEILNVKQAIKNLRVEIGESLDRQYAQTAPKDGWAIEKQERLETREAKRQQANALLNLGKIQ